MTRTLRSRRLALAGATLILGLSACGSPDSESGSSIPAPAVIDVAGLPGGTEVPAADSAMPSKMMPMNLTYVYGGELVDLTSPSASWFFAPGGVPTDEQVLTIAAAFGVEGSVRRLAADMGGGWMVGSDDYSQPSVTVGSDATLSWWYNPGSVAVDASMPCDLYPPGDPAGDFEDEPLPLCQEPEPPANVLTAAEAEAKATALFTSFGLNVANFRLETYADEWSANVTAYLVLDGVEADLSMSVGYGAEGAVTWAGGFLATPQRGPDYPRLGIEAGVERLNSLGGWGLMYQARGTNDVGYAETGVATSSGAGVAVPETAAPAVPGTELVVVTGAVEPPPETVTVETVPAETVMVDRPIDCTDPAVDCMPVESVPQEPITVTLTNASPSLVQLWASDGTVWLLPGYDFDSADGGIYTVLAIEDQYLHLAEPEPLPMPLPEPVPAETVVVDPLPVETVVVEPATGTGGG